MYVVVVVTPPVWHRAPAPGPDTGHTAVEGEHLMVHDWHAGRPVETVRLH
ncbi:hypothetical protein [Kitasatospora sp. Ki12]